MVYRIAAVGAGIFLQHHPRPVQRAQQQPCGLHTIALGSLHLHITPLLPQCGRSQRGHHHHRQHGSQQRRAALAQLCRGRGPSEGRRARAASRRRRRPPWGEGAKRHRGGHDLLFERSGFTQSSVSTPFMARPGGKVSSSRMPSGKVGRARLPSSDLLPSLDCGLVQALLR